MDEEFNVGSQGDVARFFKVKRRTVEEWRANGMPGHPRRYNLADILQWLRSDGPATWREKESASHESDPNLVGETSPGLERYRQAKAELAEIELERQKGTLLDADALSDCLNQLGACFGRALTTLQRREQHEAFDVVTEALEEFNRRALDILGSAHSIPEE